MGWREITVKESVAESIAEIAWYIASRGLVATAEKFADELIVGEFIPSKNIHL